MARDGIAPRCAIRDSITPFSLNQPPAEPATPIPALAVYERFVALQANRFAADRHPWSPYPTPDSGRAQPRPVV